MECEHKFVDIGKCRPNVCVLCGESEPQRSTIRADELRIGNWVCVNDKFVQVTDIFDGGINMCEDNYEVYPLHYLKDVQPIPLTMGVFAKVNFDKHWYDFFIDNPKGCLNDVEYLHQLQNLYFALTGKELTVNLPVAV